MEFEHNPPRWLQRWCSFSIGGIWMDFDSFIECDCLLDIQKIIYKLSWHCILSSGWTSQQDKQTHTWWETSGTVVLVSELFEVWMICIVYYSPFIGVHSLFLESFRNPFLQEFHLNTDPSPDLGPPNLWMSVAVIAACTCTRKKMGWGGSKETNFSVSCNEAADTSSTKRRPRRYHIPTVGEVSREMPTRSSRFDPLTLQHMTK